MILTIEHSILNIANEDGLVRELLIKIPLLNNFKFNGIKLKILQNLD